MTPDSFLHLAIRPALLHLRNYDDRLCSPEAAAMLLAIALQESNLKHRQQVEGPARGFYQFETIGIRGVQEHPATSKWASELLATFVYDPSARASSSAIEHNDAYATCIARLALWPDPEPLPAEQEVGSSGEYYLRRWRPGRPRMEKWKSNYHEAWQCVNQFWQ